MNILVAVSAGHAEFGESKIERCTGGHGVPVAGSAQNGAVLPLQRELRLGVIKSYRTPASDNMTMLAPIGIDILCQISLMWIAVAGLAASRLERETDCPGTAAVGFLLAVAVIARNREMGSSQRVLGLIMLADCKKCRAESLDRMALLAGPFAIASRKGSFVEIAVTVGASGILESRYRLTGQVALLALYTRMLPLK